MIETTQTVLVGCDIDATWDYAKNFERWASIMPGYQSCEIEDEDNSRWILKVGVGAMIRTVKVRVHVEKWAGPERVDFTFELEGDPVTGSGSYLAAPADGGQTDMTLHVKVAGTGPMAPMWEAMGGPVLPKFAKGFAEQLKGRIEEVNGVTTSVPPAGQAAKSGGLAALAGWLKSLWKALFHRRSSELR
ncbi:CoxG family protein [Novosphingobium mangrovi (ex Huang et al. 2023)]|uniref:SRPBCC family protein n=1 Tax=Novosphingobium mangrovi (ex Huang et al. 2023) TaxID=2976432 RepID=A0ABT2I609_9SPHN|nr:SRPBCC family protein [Novosphingobium mangrovi (ex Huang et al. 2023)]MCT2400239.1 SRPBCC family protein [Novosphingobium mangrovi (ex Huang et al. 2023)]